MDFTPSTVKLTREGQKVETRTDTIFIAVCTVRQRQVNAAMQLLAQCKQMPWLTSALKGRHLLSHTSGKHYAMPSVP